MKLKIAEASHLYDIAPEHLLLYIKEEWIGPMTNSDEYVLDEEDIARINFIHDLKYDFGVNDEAVPIILHLMDQLMLLTTKNVLKSRVI